MKLRPDQLKAQTEIYHAWNQGFDNVLLVYPTGGGKTVIFSDILRLHRGACCAIAHRQELVTQISTTLNRSQVWHRIIAPDEVCTSAVANHMADEQSEGRSYYHPHAPCAVIGIHTLLRRYKKLQDWLQSVTLWIIDEAHHVLATNIYGRACDMFPNAKGLGVTATANRADGKGLGRVYDGVFDILVQGPGTRDLINQRLLADYRVFVRPSAVDYSQVKIDGTGDLNQRQLKKAVKDTPLMGDIVRHYKELAPGKLGVTFLPDVDSARETAKNYNDAGVPAVLIEAKTPTTERVDLIKKFRNKQILNLVNVDVFGEGFDLPAIEVVSMARRTYSFPVYSQQWGRGLRVMNGKPYATIIDHAGNFEIHNGPPDKKISFSLEPGEKKYRQRVDDEIPYFICPKCSAPYEKIYKKCPFCKKPIEIKVEDRKNIGLVDGDLTELAPEVLAAMRGEINMVHMDLDQYRADLIAKGSPLIGQLTNVKRLSERQKVLKELGDSIAWWAGYQRAIGRPDYESYRRFFFKFGIDVLNAQKLKTQPAIELNEKLKKVLTEYGL